MTPSPSLTEILANLSVSKIVMFACAATVLRLVLVRVSNDYVRPLVEFLESMLIAVVLVYLLIRPFIVQAYFIPSPSMEPTLLGNNGVGDRILVNKMVYRVSTPRRGDVVVFIPPPNATEGGEEEQPGVPVNYIKRLVGEPGDVIVVHAGKIVVNNAVYDHQQIRTQLQAANLIGAMDGDANPLQDQHHIKFRTDGVLVDGKQLISKRQIATVLADNPNATVTVVPGYTTRNGQRVPDWYTAEDPDYDMKLYHGMPLKVDYDPENQFNEYLLDGNVISKAEYDRDNLSPPGAIPAGTFFMMGDNRNDSKDSTYWGPLERNRVVGKAEYIFFPFNRISAIH